MNPAAYLIVGPLLIAFGTWRLLAGLYILDLIDRRVPGHDLFMRFVPGLMRGSAGSEGLADIFGGLIFAAGGTLALVSAF